MEKKLLELSGVIQDYAWGGDAFLADFTQRQQPENTPWAELWLGAHPKGPAMTSKGTLNELLKLAPSQWLGGATIERWGPQIPFLLKVLDVKKMLSIQVHPTKAAAEIGFAYEEMNGPERTAPNRNYRDNNHKPELGVAITDFYLLHGFKSIDAIRKSLQEVPGWSALLPVLESGGLEELYAHVMQADQAKVNTWLQPLSEAVENGDYQSSSADFWAQRAFEQYADNGNFDRGIFSIYWFNLVHLRPGEGIFQAAGVPHAYLEGVCVELMANSDNVLRGGLTPKHIDVPELMKQLDFTPVNPNVLKATGSDDGIWKTYQTPAPDFELSKLEIAVGETVEIAENQIAIFLVFSGALTADGTHFSRGQSFVVAAKSRHQLIGVAPATIIFRATIGQTVN